MEFITYLPPSKSQMLGIHAPSTDTHTRQRPERVSIKRTQHIYHSSEVQSPEHLACAIARSVVGRRPYFAHELAHARAQLCSRLHWSVHVAICMHGINTQVARLSTGVLIRPRAVGHLAVS